ncbi:hypothetical protein RO3G_06683 [Lichtheimia corymbifera JMRC:FSU:9682]|uniref:Ricin B lectin domain-containing protein n=1 Tax=Lichtheimia corymbifera JMRC:FSU:9682 TaxID=1263082 RepID=A0A068RHK5_9FUNG|nr:hypothetical protein RO3G_06683 [Lichtheimia corymbifera JMRC:FSU:9682]
MVSTASSCHDDWMFIRSVSTGNVITAQNDLTDPRRSQVMVAAPRCIDEELWRWDGQFLRNKATNLVLDIRKGRLRLIQETEICLYDAKPVEEAHNQLWGVREGIMDALGRQQPGNVIYSLSNDDWVLDIHSNPENGTCKLILFPFQAVDNDFQLWTFVNENDKEQLDMAPAIKNTLPSSTIPSSEAEMYSQGLSPAKRGSQSSVTMLSLDAYRECHQMVYLERNPRLSDKAIAMAAAYETWQKWNQERMGADTMPQVDKIRSMLQSTAENEASRIFDQCDQLSNHKETALNLASRLVIQLYEQVLTSP